jgi:serine protease Do
MSEFDNENTNTSTEPKSQEDETNYSFRNNHSYGSYEDAAWRPRGARHRRGGRGWFIATLVLAAFMAGALMMRLLPPDGNSAVQVGLKATTTAAPTLAPVLASYSSKATPPKLGGEAIALGQGIDIPAIAKAVSPTVVGVVNKVKGRTLDSLSAEVEQGSGSGVVISADGYIATNNHVIAGADSVSVVFPGGKEVDATIVGADEQTDLAVLKVNEKGLAAVPIGDSDAMQVGQTVIAIGNPLGNELAGTVTAGILSARDREMLVDGYKFKLFQTDAAINPGNSGGALVNSSGQLVGINNMKSVSAGTDDFGNPISAEGIGFAIPINDALPVIQQLITMGYIPRPMLGIDAAQEITQRMASRYNVPQGILLRTLTQNGPATKAGLQANDILTELDGAPVATLADMNGVLTKHNIGDTVKAKAWRDGNELSVDIVLEGKGK